MERGNTLSAGQRQLLSFCTGNCPQSFGHRARRGHRQYRHQNRNAHPECHRRHCKRPHHADYCAPAFHDTRRRSDYSTEKGRDCRDRQPCRADEKGRLLQKHGCGGRKRKQQSYRLTEKYVSKPRYLCLHKEKLICP